MTIKHFRYGITFRNNNNNSTIVHKEYFNGDNVVYETKTVRIKNDTLKKLKPFPNPKLGLTSASGNFNV